MTSSQHVFEDHAAMRILAASFAAELDRMTSDRAGLVDTISRIRHETGSAKLLVCAC